MEGGCRGLISAIQRGRAGAPSQIEIFFSKCRRLFCGSVAGAGGADSKHPHKEQILKLSGIFQQGDTHAGICALVDIWDKSYTDFFKFAKSPSSYGEFAAPHLRHEMAERAATDVVFYAKARADPVRSPPPNLPATSPRAPRPGARARAALPPPPSAHIRPRRRPQAM